MEPIDRLMHRFEIAVGNFVRSAFDLSANEKAFQAWYAAAVIHEFGLSRVYREVHLWTRELLKLVPDEVSEGFESRLELFPDLSVSWREAIDARHSRSRTGRLSADGMLSEFGIVSEFKVTGSTARPTQPAAILADLRKLGLFATAHLSATPSPATPLACYLVVLDNHRSREGIPTRRYREGRVDRQLERFAGVWPAAAPQPVVLVGDAEGLRKYSGFVFEGYV